MTAFRLLALIAVVLVGGAAIVMPRVTPPPKHQSGTPCALPYGTANSESCAPFATVGIRVRTVIPSSAFGRETDPEDFGVLDDGSAMVQVEHYGLDRITNGRLQVLWHPKPRCDEQPHFHFSFAGTFDDQLLMKIHDDTSAAVRADGSLSFRLPIAFDSAKQDESGVVWLFKGGSEPQTIEAYFPQKRSLVTVATPKGGAYGFFRAPNGRVYITNYDGLFELDSRPTVEARMLHGPIARYGLIQAVGRDGSLWASTETDVIHMHADGTSHAMRLFNLSMMVRTSPVPPISLTMTPDGSVWNTWGKIVRIDNDDRIQVLTLPEQDRRSDVKFGPDSSLWVLAHDARTGRSQGMVNFAPAAMPRSATAWPFQPLPSTATATPFVFCPPPTPTPPPPLPPKSGPIDFVYEVGDGIRAYWAGSDGQLKPVRGSPFGANTSPLSLAFDPAGRRLYAGGWGQGIIIYDIDARSGALRPISGSPFPTDYEPQVAIDRNGAYLFAGSPNGKTITGYSIDAQSGALRPLASSPLQMNGHLFWMTVNPRRDLVYVMLPHDVQTYDTRGGVLTRLSTLALARRGNLYDLFIDPRGRWAYLIDPRGAIAIYGIDASTGLLTAPSVPAVKVAKGLHAIATDPRGRFLYVVNFRGGEKEGSIFGYRIDSQTGALRPLPTSPFAVTDPGATTITLDGAFLYTTNSSSKSISGFKIDRMTGALWPIAHSPFAAGDTPEGIISCRRVGDRCISGANRR